MEVGGIWDEEAITHRVEGGTSASPRQQQSCLNFPPSLDSPYQQIRQRLGTRQRFFNDLRALKRYLVFESWQHLLAFMLEHSASAKPMNSS